MIMWATSTVVKHPLLAVDNSEDIPPAEIPFFFERTLVAAPGQLWENLSTLS
jgi:hypothetical protein